MSMILSMSVMSIYTSIRVGWSCRDGTVIRVAVHG